MNKNEFELHKLSISSRNFALGVGLIKTLATLGCALGAVWILMDGVKTMVGTDADSLTALAYVVEKLHLGSILSYFVAVGTGAGWVLERRGKKRAVGELGQLRRQLEAADPHRGSSNLDHHGHTPK